MPKGGVGRELDARERKGDGPNQKSKEDKKSRGDPLPLVGQMTEEEHGTGRWDERFLFPHFFSFSPWLLLCFASCMHKVF
jgi:hypothetical protein